MVRNTEGSGRRRKVIEVNAPTWARLLEPCIGVAAMVDALGPGSLGCLARMEGALFVILA